ncbi:MAG: hypothetical protein KGH89_08760 [Thaumarchaeota archaeon]|nr:hypothetical protein [Nitrososphaerota archaeon]
MKKQYLGLLLIIPIFTVSAASTFTISPANALVQRDFSFLNDQHLTAGFGENKVCGDHMCAPGEWSKLQMSINAAQLGNKTESTSHVTMTTVPSMSAPVQNVSGMTPQASTASSQDLGSVLKLSNANLPIVIPLVRGLYDGKDVFYITTEASNSNVASTLTNFTNFPVTYAPTLAKAPPSALAQFYIFKNGVKGSGELGFQPTVSDSIPGDSGYSPLWQINYVEWKDPTNATILGSDDQITDVLNQGKITVTPTNIVVNAPIIQWGGNNQGTISAGNMKMRDNITESGAYGNAQVLSIDTQKMQVTFVAHRGFAPDGSTIYYIATDASQMGPANALGVVFTNKTQNTISTSSSADLYQFSNGIAGSGPLGFQSGVASAKEGDKYYSPMWRIQVITWKDPSMATVLENIHDITSKSDLTTTKLAGFVVNCPFFSAETVYSHMQ